MGEPTMMYHPEHGAQVFDSKDLERLNSEWKDAPSPEQHPNQLEQRKATVKEEKQDNPPPEAYLDQPPKAKPGRPKKEESENKLAE